VGLIFECKNCGFCCTLEVRLFDADIDRLWEAGKKDFFYVMNGTPFLKSENGRCLFHDKNCTVYDDRPLICRKFPFRKDGHMSEKCSQRQDFSARVGRKIIKFMQMGK